MLTIPDTRLAIVELKARMHATVAARELVHASPAERELLRSALDCEKWLADSCRCFQ